MIIVACCRFREFGFCLRVWFVLLFAYCRYCSISVVACVCVVVVWCSLCMCLLLFVVGCCLCVLCLAFVCAV